MIRYQTRPRQRERTLLAMAILVIVSFHCLTLIAFKDLQITSTINLSWLIPGLIIQRSWFDKLMSPIFALFVSGIYLTLRRKRRMDFIIYPVMVCLCGMGLFQIVRIGYDDPDLAKLAPRQLGFMLFGFILFTVIVKCLSYKTINLLSGNGMQLLYILLSVAIIVYTILHGDGNAGRAISIKIGPFTVMPVEYVKILLILFAASFFGRRGVVDPKGASSSQTLPFVLLVAAVLSLLVIQKDIGPLIVMFGVLTAMYGIATGRWWKVVIATVSLFVIGAIAYMTRTPTIVRTRFDMVRHPFTTSDQTVRALWSQSAGGIFGTGWGQGTSYRIAEVQSDFNFVVFSEELGFIGACLIIILYALFAYAGLRIAMTNADPFRRLLAAGLSVMIFLQTFVIIAGDTALLPLTGITLPFISYGGSSLLSQFIQAGILYRLSCADMERPK